jgi:hypothetical protein
MRHSRLGAFILLLCMHTSRGIIDFAWIPASSQPTPNPEVPSSLHRLRFHLAGPRSYRYLWRDQILPIGPHSTLIIALMHSNAFSRKIEHYGQFQIQIVGPH